jgi:hypothetical protein
VEKKVGGGGLNWNGNEICIIVNCEITATEISGPCSVTVNDNYFCSVFEQVVPTPAICYRQVRLLFLSRLLHGADFFLTVAELFKKFPVFHGAHPASYPVDIRGSFPGGKADRA